MKRDNRNIASDLMESTVKVIARDGFAKASTRNIAGECDLPDAYIYTHFKDKEDLFAQTFRKKDDILAREVRKYLPIMNRTDMTIESRFFFLFSNMWFHLTAYPDRCRFYVQYYYSPYYQKYSAREHLTLWMPVVEQMKEFFQTGVDVKATLRSALNTTLCQAIKAASEPLAEKSVLAQKNYDLVYGLIRANLLEH